MRRTLQWIAAGALAVAGAATGIGAHATEAAAKPALTAAQIVERYVAARGGADAWRQIQTMGWTGRIESAGGKTPNVPFLMLFKRPNATHFEIAVQNQKSLRIFDGTQGWKLRPTSQGTPELVDYTPEELSYARDAAGLDGPLIDYRTKGVSVVLQGRDTVEGHAAYRLRVTLPSGQTQVHWIDAHSFLLLKYDRTTHNQAGQAGIVSVHLRNYQTIKGLAMPLLIETGGEAGQGSDKMVIEKVAFNPVLEEAVFARPGAVPKRRSGVLINTAEPPPATEPAPASAH